MIVPRIIFLDTNVYIIGTAHPDSAEGQILGWVERSMAGKADVEVVVSAELFEQILRVSRRLKNKDWGGEILARIWQNMPRRYVLIDHVEWSDLAGRGIIPREDVGIYLAARNGGADHFVSSNHELIRELSNKTGEFACLTPEGFLRVIQ